MGELLRPRYDYANATTVLPEEDSQAVESNDKASVESERQKVRDSVWAGFEPSHQNIVVKADPSKSTIPQPEAAYADWHVDDIAGRKYSDEAEVIKSEEDDDIEENDESEEDDNIDIPDNLSRPSGGVIRPKRGVIKNGNRFEKGESKAELPIGASVIIEQGRKAAGVEKRMIRDTIRSTIMNRSR